MEKSFGFSKNFKTKHTNDPCQSCHSWQPYTPTIFYHVSKYIFLIELTEKRLTMETDNEELW